jgi:hypothetical protein
VTKAADGHRDAPSYAVGAQLGLAGRALLRMRTILCLVIAVLAASGCSGVTASTAGAKPTTVRTARSSVAPPVSALSAPGTAQSAPAAGIWKLKWQANFSEPAKLGSFSGCNNYDRTPEAFCSGLPADLQSQWWAYPYPWEDSAIEAHKPIGGYYDPAGTVWISGGAMHIRMYRTTGSIHSAAVLPKAAIGMVYGKYVETFSVSPDSADGYRSSHMLWPTDNLPAVGDEVDFPEGEWDSTFCVHVHSLLENDGRAVSNFCPNIGWAGWNTTEIDWSPGSLKFYLDGKLIGSLTGKWVPNTPMSWILQNESALYGPEAAENSSAQLNISSLAVYSYQGPAAG